MHSLISVALSFASGSLCFLLCTLSGSPSDLFLRHGFTKQPRTILNVRLSWPCLCKCWVPWHNASLLSSCIGPCRCCIRCILKDDPTVLCPFQWLILVQIVFFFPYFWIYVVLRSWGNHLVEKGWKKEREKKNVPLFIHSLSQIQYLIKARDKSRHFLQTWLNSVGMINLILGAISHPWKCQ